MYRQSGKNLLSCNISSTCPHNMVNFDPLAAEIGPVVWGTPANFNRFRVLATLLHGTPVLGISQTLRRWTEGATYIRQGGHHVGHRPKFQFILTWVIFQDFEDRSHVYNIISQTSTFTSSSLPADLVFSCLVGSRLSKLKLMSYARGLYVVVSSKA